MFIIGGKKVDEMTKPRTSEYCEKLSKLLLDSMIVNRTAKISKVDQLDEKSAL